MTPESRNSDARVDVHYFANDSVNRFPWQRIHKQTIDVLLGYSDGTGVFCRPDPRLYNEDPMPAERITGKIS
jgi:hypothetical protein